MRSTVCRSHKGVGHGLTSSTDMDGPWHLDLALAQIPPALSASQGARNSCRNSNTVAENELRILSLALSLALSRALSLFLSLTHTHTHTHTNTGGVAHTRLPRGEYGTAGETICVRAQASLSLWMTDWAELDFITFPQHVCCVCSKQTEPDSSDATLRPL